jgi:TPR repeat protein
MGPSVAVGSSTTSARSGLAARLVAAALASAALPLLAAGCAAVGERVGAVGDGLGTLADFTREPGDADRVNFKIALSAARRGNYEAAARAYARMYDHTGHPYAALQLGRYHAEGRGVPRDPAKAAEFFRASYERNWRGRGEAAYGLARLYDTGEGVPADKERAYALYSYAFEQGVTSAAFPLAKAFDEGSPVGPDRTRARTLYEVAAGAGEARAALRLAEIRLEDGASPVQARAVARPGVAWLRELAKQDNDWAEMRLATIYQEGRLAEADPELADRYLRDAAKHGNGTANARLAERAERATRGARWATGGARPRRATRAGWSGSGRRTSRTAARPRGSPSWSARSSSATPRPWSRSAAAS